MVGFPGETDEEFQKTVEFVKSIAFADAHIFQYSQRKGTPAAVRPDQIDPKIKEQRSKIIEKITSESKAEFEQGFIGKTVEVLFEQPCHSKKGWFEGKTGNYLTVIVPEQENLSGKFCNVLLKKITPFGIEGEIKGM